MNALIIGVANSIEKMLMPLSIMKRSELIRLISLPEFVSVKLFIESLSTLSNSEMTSVLRALSVIWLPFRIYRLRINYPKYIDVPKVAITLTPLHVCPSGSTVSTGSLINLISS